MDLFGLAVTDFFSILFFLIPGFVALQFYYYLSPARDPSDFQRITLAVMISTLSNWIVTVLLQIVPVGVWILPHSGQYPIAFLALSSVFGSLGMLGWVVLLKNVEFQRLSKRIFDVDIYPQGKLWNNFFHIPAFSVVKVFLSNGIVYVGQVGRASTDPNDKPQELLLLSPMYFDQTQKISTKIEETQSVLVSSDHIVSIELIEEKEAKQLYNIDIVQA